MCNKKFLHILFNFITNYKMFFLIYKNRHKEESTHLSFQNISIKIPDVLKTKKICLNIQNKKHVS